jgi:hypothetical protein
MINTSQLCILILFLLAFAALLPRDAFAVEKKFQWSTRITVSQQYDDNIELTADDSEEEDDWITIVGPGLTLAVLFEETEIELNYDLGFSYYAKNDENNDVRHSLTLSGLQDIPIAEHWTLDVEQSFLVSEDPVEISEQTTSVQRSRERYYSNTAGARLNYLFGAGDSLYFGFRHQILINDDREVEDSQEFRPGAGINYWFSLRHGINLGYEYAYTDLEDSEDVERHVGRVNYNYRFSPRTQANISYSINSTNFDGDEDDYVVHTGRLGFSQQVAEHTSWSVSGGAFLRDNEGSDKEQGFDGAASLSQALEKGSLSFSASGGYREQYVEAENLGFSQFYRASLGFSYELLERLSINISGFYQRDEYKDTTPSRDDDTFQGRVALDYLLLPWLSSSLSYQYRERQSSEEVEEYQNQRVMITLVAFYVSQPHSF